MVVFPTMRRSGGGLVCAALVIAFAVREHPALAQSAAQSSGLRAGPEGPAAAGSAVQAMQSSLLADPETLGMVLDLQNDPLVQQILRDDETMRALQAGDLERLLGNPMVRALAEHPTVKGIAGRQAR
jgi:hypothetical protein